MTHRPLSLERTLSRFEREAEQHVFFTGRYHCRYRAWGSGPLLVLIHGLADQARSFDFLIALLQSRFRCVAYELPNGLDDDASLGRYRHVDYASDFLALLDHLHADSALVLGSSFGSTVALRVAAANPERLSRVVLQGGFARRPLKWLERRLAQLAQYWPGRMGDVPGRRRVMGRLDRPAFAAAPREVYDFFLRCSGATPIRAAARRGLLLDRLDLRPILPEVRQPVLLLGGDRDTIVPRACEEALLANLADVRRVEFLNCGHYPQYTHPAAMAEAILSFAGGSLTKARASGAESRPGLGERA